MDDMTRGEVTIAVHNGTQVATGHNLRDPEICAHEPHIDPDGIHEIWHHEALRSLYDRTFGEPQREYDRKARASRRIGDYLDAVTRDADEAQAANDEIIKRNKLHKAAGEPLEKLRIAKKPVYEIIAGIYPQGGLELTAREQRDALHLYVMGDGTPEHPSWEDRNPGLKLVGVYYHADEPDAAPHVHIDYVPVAECSRGMRRQNSLEGALKMSGYASGKVVCDDGHERLKTAQEQFTDAERDCLQALCEEMGLDVLHPQRGTKSTHKSTAEKKRETRAANLDAEMEAARQEFDELEASLQRWSDRLDVRSEQLDTRGEQLDARGEQLDAREAELAKREKALELREKAVETRETALNDIDAAKYKAATKPALNELRRRSRASERASDAAQQSSRSAYNAATGPQEDGTIDDIDF